MSVAPSTSASEADMANAIRFLAIDAINNANSGHPGMPMGMADVATVLFNRFLKFDPLDPTWPDRDRFVLSAGHGSMLLYSVLALTGYEGVEIADLQTFRQLRSPFAGHPEYGHCPGVETTTGPLGQGLATAVGMAIAERSLNATFGDDLVDHFTYVVGGDGCLMEGISHEAIDLAGSLELDRLIVLWDNNQITIDGSTQLSTATDQQARFRSAGWDVLAVDGHNHHEIAAALEAARNGQRPTLIDCQTVIGFGSPNKAGTNGVHGSPLGSEETRETRKNLGWEAAPFVVPDVIRDAWLAAGKRGTERRRMWDQTSAKNKLGPEFKRWLTDPIDMSGELSSVVDEAIASKSAAATRASSLSAIEAMVAGPQGVRLLGGSADLTGSNLTRATNQATFDRSNRAGTYIHYGIREHAMAAAMNGIALHGGYVPYGGTFFVFADYLRPALRLSALMGTQVIYVMTHDSIGLGEDGPTHQPVEHLASLRAMPNVDVYRPADAVETAEAWAAALATTNRPSVLCLSRQGLPLQRTTAPIEGAGDNPTESGAYVLVEPSSDRQATIVATGSEIQLAVEAAKQLDLSGVSVAVVSMPCWEQFERQDAVYRQAVLGDAPRVGVEAGVGFGWERWLGGGPFVGMKSFGASGPANELFDLFSITVESVVNAVTAAISSGQPSTKEA